MRQYPDSRFTTTTMCDRPCTVVADLGISMPSPKVDTERVIAWLASSRFCAELDAEAIQAIADQLQVRPFTAGETLASAGDAVTEFWIVAEGELDSYLIDARGRERRHDREQPDVQDRHRAQQLDQSEAALVPVQVGNLHATGIGMRGARLKPPG